MTMDKGFFITIEGVEGSGKSTQADLLCRFLKRRGHRVLHTREPGGTRFTDDIRRILLNPENHGRIAPMTELFLYEADRAQHVAEILLPALAKGFVVVCDRYTDATEAYQGYGRKISLEAIRTLNKIAAQDLRPDLTILLDVPVEKGLARAKGLKKKISAKDRGRKGGDRLERESLDFHRRVRQGYLAAARREPRRVKLVPQIGDAAAVHSRVADIVDGFLGRKR